MRGSRSRVLHGYGAHLQLCEGLSSIVSRFLEIFKCDAASRMRVRNSSAWAGTVHCSAANVGTRHIGTHDARMLFMLSLL